MGISAFPAATASAAASLAAGYNLYAWTPNASDAYPLGGGAITIYAGHPTISPTGASAAQTVYRNGLIRQPAGSSPGNIILSGNVIDQGGAGLGHFGLGLNNGTAFGSTDWSEGVCFSYDAGADTVKCYTSAASGTNIYAYVSGGTQRGSTVSGLSPAVAYPFRVTVSAAGNVKFEFNGSTVFDGAGGVDLIGAAGNTAVAFGFVAATTAGSVGLTSLAVTYS